jgi:hypothetical protein
MILLIAAALWCTPQDSPVPPLLAKISDSDPRAAFDAIRALADLDPRLRPEIAKGAAALPAFYRDALLAELEASTDGMRRITMDRASRLCGEHLVEAGKLSGLKLRLRPEEHHRIDGKDPEPFEVAFQGTPLVRAVSDLCSLGSRYAWFNAMSREVHVETGSQRATAGFGGRSAALFFQGVSWSKRVDFGSPPVWKVGLGFSALVGRPDWVVGWKDVRIVEAVGDGGAPLAPVRYDDSASAYAMEEFRAPDSVYRYNWVGVAVQAPKEAKSIAKLKVSATALTAGRTRTLELVMDKKEGTSSAEADGWRATVSSVEPSPIRTTRIKVRVRPEGISAEELLTRTCLAQGAYAERLENAVVRRLRVVEGEVELSLTFFPPEKNDESVTGLLPERIRILLAESVESRRVFAEFREIPLR